MGDAVLVYDDDCGFCTWWADYFARHTDIDVVGFTELSPDLKERLPDNYESCSHLITNDGVYSCGASIEQASLHTPIGRPLRPFVQFLRQFEDYDRLRERAYRAIADRRSLWGRVVSRPPPARTE